MECGPHLPEIQVSTMKTRGYVRINDDSQLDQIPAIAEQLRGAGLELDATDIELAGVTGQLTGSSEPKDVGRIQERAAALGARYIPEQEDGVHRLPHPSDDLQ